MNIYAKEGSKVVFANPNNGYQSDKKQCERLLTLNAVYTINATDVGSSHTDVYLKEFPDEVFNSVMFEDYEGEVLEDKERDIEGILDDTQSLANELLRSKSQIAELQANNNRLREALKYYADMYAISNLSDVARQALSKTPAQSLQSVINETIEMCAEEVEERGSRFEAEIIRALKDNYDR